MVPNETVNLNPYTIIFTGLPVGTGKLGTWSEEMCSSHILRYGSTGSKTYGITFRDPRTGTISKICKAKGFTLRSANCEAINTDSLINMAASADLEAVLLGEERDEIRSDLPKLKLYAKKNAKRLKVTSRERRFFIDEYRSVPFGTKDV